MIVPRLRMIAGPNGSGKTTLLNHLGGLSFPMGHCQNPDEIEKHLVSTGMLDFSTMGLRVRQQELRAFIGSHPLATPRWKAHIHVDGNVLRIGRPLVGGYFTAALCDFIRQRWLASEESFTFETVMSSQDKVELLRRAQEHGYRTYLYYICTSSARINLERVAVRVARGGHDVLKEKIQQRYGRSLGLLASAIASANRAYLFDNSGKSHRFVGEFEDGKLIRATKKIPAWFAMSGWKP